jgi:hypothetical protein
MRNEHPTLTFLRSEATAHGEIAAASTDAVTIEGDFTPGLSAYDFRPGARVFILTEDDAIAIFDRTGVEL